MASLAHNQAAWNDFALRQRGSFLQSWEWGVFQRSLGRDVRRIAVGRQGGGDAAEVAAQAIVLPLPLGQRYLYVPRGPVWAGAADAEKLGAFAATLRAVVAEIGCAFAKVDLPEEAGGPLSPEMLRAAGLRKGRAMQPGHTSIVDLRQTEEQLLAAMHPKTRYNIRVAQRHGVTVRDAAPEDAGRFLALLEETASRDGFHLHESKYYAAMLATLSPDPSRQLAVRLRIAEKDGSLLAGAVVASFGETTTYLHGASSSSQRELMAPYALHWETMREEKAAGRSAYDFWGVAPLGEEQHSWAGISRFKRGFGGAEVSYLGGWELPGRGPWYTLYRAAKFLRR